MDPMQADDLAGEERHDRLPEYFVAFLFVVFGLILGLIIGWWRWSGDDGDTVAAAAEGQATTVQGRNQNDESGGTAGARTSGSETPRHELDDAAAGSGSRGGGDASDTTTGTDLVVDDGPHGHLGVVVVDLDDLSSSRRSELPGTGAYVTETRFGSAAREAGLREGDVIVEVNAEGITSVRDLVDTIDRHDPGDFVVVRFFRNGGYGVCEFFLDAEPA